MGACRERKRVLGEWKSMVDVPCSRAIVSVVVGIQSVRRLVRAIPEA